MDACEFERSCLRDQRLAPLATSPLPAWLWKRDASGILWANPIGAAIFGASTSAALSVRDFNREGTAVHEIARLAATLTTGAPPRLERLRGFVPGVGRALTCACSAIVLGDGTAGILVAATEPAGLDLALDERVRRLLAGATDAIAAFSVAGELIAANAGAEARMRGATSLAALGAQALAAAALARGQATGSSDRGVVGVDRVGSCAATVLLVCFDAPPANSAATSPPPLADAEPAPITPPTERRHPLRFVWQMDEEGRFTLDSGEFKDLIGPRTAAALSGTWAQMADALGLDPDAQVARALASRETWSGLTVAWPVDDGAERLAVELSGLPVFDRDRRYRGYRGFGMCRDLARLTALARWLQEQPARAAVGGTMETAPPLAAGASNEIMSATTRERAALRPVPRPSESLGVHERGDAARPPPRDTVVPFRPAAGEPAPALSAIERSAFRELSRKLSERLAAAGITHHSAEALADPSDSETSDIEAAGPDSAAGMLVMLERLPVGILVYRRDQLIYANPLFLEWSGHASLHELSAAGGLDQLFTAPRMAVAPGAGPVLTLPAEGDAEISLEGELIDILWEGEPAHALITTAPVRKPAKLEAARAEIAELQSILDTATDGVVVLDREARILSVSRSAQALFGCEADELTGRTFDELFAADSAAAARECLERPLRDDMASVVNGGCEVIGRVRKGGSIALFMAVRRVGDAGKLCAVFRDITPWKKSEQELVNAKHEAEKASSAKSDFLAKVSHEIRTPLNAIIGFSEVMIEERFGPIANERYREYLRDIHTSGGHLLSLINDLLDLSKIEARKLELNFAAVALNDIVQQCVAIMQPQANRERVIIRTSLPLSLPQVVADARSLRQIVLNLLWNSVKFTGAGGQVIVSTAFNDQGEVVLRVRDTGIGMSEKDIVTALEPFRQLATSAPGGCGLGLPLTKALAEANRVDFRIRSAPREGTLVEICFPPAQVLAGSPSKMRGPTPASNIDGDDINRT